MLLESQQNVKKSKSTWTNQGGSVDNSGMICILDIFPTVEKIEKALGLDAKNNLLGSAGKRKFSGDIDIAVSDTIDKEKFIETITNSDVFVSVSGKSPISTLVKIETNDETVYSSVPYTGYVQVDFIFGNEEWLKLYYYSPTETQSKYKGTYRNMLMASISANFDTNQYEYPENKKLVRRYKWSPNDGLVKIERTYEYDSKKQSYKKKHTDRNISKSYMTEDEIINVLQLPNIECLHSFENLYNGIVETYEPEIVNNIIEDFIGSLNNKKMEIPIEIK